MAIFKLKIKYDEDKKEVMKISINDDPKDPNNYKEVDPDPNGTIDGKPIIDEIKITEGSRCVWRNGRLYC